MTGTTTYADLIRWIDLGEAKQHVDDFRQALASTDPYTRWAGIKGCGEVHDDASIPRLISVLSSPAADLGETDERRIAVWSLAKFSFDELRPFFDSLNRSSNVLLVEGIADLLGCLGDPRGLSLLDEFLHVQDRSVLLWVSLSLAKLGAGSVPIVERHLSRAPSIEKTFYLLDALEKIGSPSALDARTQAIKGSALPEIRQMP